MDICWITFKLIIHKVQWLSTSVEKCFMTTKHITHNTHKSHFFYSLELRDTKIFTPAFKWQLVGA